MKMKLLQPERPKTQTEIRRLFRNVSEEKAVQFDKNIRKKIANDSSHESINKYVADEIKGKKQEGSQHRSDEENLQRNTKKTTANG